MTSKRRERMESEIFRRKVREMMAAKATAAAIAKATGKSLIHVKQIMAQEAASSESTNLGG